MLRKAFRLTREALHRYRYGAPGAIVTLNEWRAQHPDGWVHAALPDPVPRIQPRRFGARPLDLAARIAPIPEMGCLILPGGRAVAAGNHTFAADGTIVRETTWQNELLKPGLIHSVFPPARRLAGTCLSLLSEFSAENYGHFVLDALGRVEVARMAGYAPGDFDHVYLQRPPSRTARQLLEAVGIDPSRCISADVEPSIVAERLVVTTFPGTKANYARFVPRALRRPFDADGVSGTRRIFIPRGGNRRPANQAELIAIARRFDFEVYDWQAVADEVRHFREAGIVVGAHGADLSNIAVCHPGTRILEMIPTDHVHPYFYTIAEGAGLDYSYLAGVSESHRPPGTFGPSLADFHVDEAEFSVALAALAA